MKKFLKMIMAFAIVATMGACSKTEAEGDLNSAAAGIVAGSQEDLNARAGNMVFFDYDKFNIRAGQDTEVLKRQAAWLKLFPKVNVIVEGHTDERGTRKYNQALGERRANAVKRYLIAQGVSAKRITTVSYGKDRPMVLGSNEEAWAQNRRAVSIVVAE